MRMGPSKPQLFFVRRTHCLPIVLHLAEVLRLVQKTRYKRRKAHTIVNAMKLELMEQKRRWEAAHQQRPVLAPEVSQGLGADRQAPSAA